MLSIVIVDWNTGPALAACLASLVADGLAEREVVLVDNGSTDGGAVEQAARHPWVRLVPTGENLGFAAGANRGAAVAGGDPLVFLNPDARVEPGAVEQLVRALAAVPGVGIAGGGLARPDGGWQPGAARFGPLAHLLLDTTIGRAAVRRRRAAYRVDWVYGTFMAVRRDVFTALGGFDERYFLYGEDLDLCYRAARAGHATLHVPAARATHGANVGARRRFGVGREAQVVRGEMLFYATWGRPALARFRAVAIAKFGMKALVAAGLRRRAAAAAYTAVVRACLVGDAACPARQQTG